MIEQRMKLEDMVEQLAKDQVSLESQAKNSLKSVKKGAEIVPTCSDEDDDDFVDAFDYPAEEFKVAQTQSLCLRGYQFVVVPIHRPFHHPRS